MPRAKKKHSAEEIIPKLRTAEFEIANGRTAAEAAKKIGVTEQTYYRWRKEYGGLRTDQAKRLKELEKENARRKRLFPPWPSSKYLARMAVHTPVEVASIFAEMKTDNASIVGDMLYAFQVRTARCKHPKTPENKASLVC